MLRQAYLELGHDVRTIEPVPGLPDMVFAANGATVVDGTVLGARFRYPQRAAEAGAYLQWFRDQGYRRVRAARHVNEGEGDIMRPAGCCWPATASAPTRPPRPKLAEVFGRPVVSLRLVDPCFYHLDTALCVLGPDAAMYYPAAFDEAGQGGHRDAVRRADRGQGRGR